MIRRARMGPKGFHSRSSSPVGLPARPPASLLLHRQVQARVVLLGRRRGQPRLRAAAAHLEHRGQAFDACRWLAGARLAAEDEGVLEAGDDVGRPSELDQR